MRNISRWSLIACSLGVFWAASAGAVDRLEEFAKAKRTLQPQLRSKQTEDRLAAVKKLQEFPIEDATRLLNNALSDPEIEVREAAYDVLTRLSDKQEVCNTLLLLIKKGSHRKDDGAEIAPLLAVLLRSKLPSVERDVAELLDKLAASSPHGIQVLITAIDEMGEHHRRGDVVPLVKLTKCKVFADNFGIRRAVVNSLAQIPYPEAIGALIEMMSAVAGEAQADAVEHLAQVTNQIFGMETAAWQRWWADSKGTFEYPKRKVEAAYRSVALSTAGTYYGLPLFAERLVFVLDTSGSMAGQRIMAAKRELINAISGLPDHAEFGVVVFNSSVATWQKQLVKATAPMKKAAIHYVESQSTQSNTASYDALEAAFRFDTEAIYFLSDGAPHGGKIAAPVDIVAAISGQNKTRRVSLYTIGIGAGIPGGPLDTFLSTLAEQNYGLYRRVDQ